ncbi:DNA-processing protein DprA [Aerosakkonemataceae cyanobacterium BLCC-F50]|uniref:DNA-processing protein DprA n=1 Tax=Floridaenema flaviceps BLCC-F50 TaxID=3153642 RepID=A0ABV4Y437_9CYAN
MEERVFWLAWAQISGVGPILLKRLQNHFISLSAAWEASPNQLREVEGFGNKTVQAVVEKRAKIDPEKLLKQHLEKNPNFWTPADPEYPRLLLEIPNPPPVLYYRGKPQLSENQGITPTIGIVGTRSLSEYGKRWTRKISAALAKQGFTIVSGMAEGIDTEAHDACLEVGGRTLAVLGTGVDVVYPPSNRRLYDRILENGLVLSEYIAGTQPNRTNFPPRNRIIAGLSRAVLVMEAPNKSGALITADYTKDLQRDIYVLTARLEDYNSHGCLKLLNKGANAIPVEFDQLLTMLGAKPVADKADFSSLPLFNQPQIERSPTPIQPPTPELEPDLKQVFQTLTTEPLSFDLIVQQSGLAASVVSSALLQLELMGLVTQLPGMRYQKC